MLSICPILHAYTYQIHTMNQLVLYLDLDKISLYFPPQEKSKKVGNVLLSTNVQKDQMKKSEPRLFPLLFLLAPLFVASLLFAHRFFFIPSLSFNDILISDGNKTVTTYNTNNAEGMCSEMANNTICCDRTNYHSDICFLKGNTITNPSSSSILLPSNPNSSYPTVEKIRPYTRKWEPFIMNKIPELRLKTINPSIIPHCDVRHSVTALFFSLGGYTGNIFHAFSNGLIPLYITSQHLNRQVVFVILEYRLWWYTKYREILSQLSAYPIIDFSNDERVHCFPEAIVGLRFHDTLMIDPSRMRDNKSTIDFKTMLDQAYQNQIKKQKQDQNHSNKPKLVIVARKQTRAIENEQEVVAMAKDIGFEIEVLRPKNTMQMSTIYESLSTCDIMMGVHGAALTHFFFLRPESLFIQIVPLGLDEPARMCFGDVVPKFGIEYEEYKIRHTESSLYTKYGGDDPIVRDPESVMKGKGWEFTKKVYLEGQNVTLDINRLRERLILAFQRGKQN